MFVKFIALLLMISTDVRSTNTRDALTVSRLAHHISDMYLISVITVDSSLIYTKPALNSRISSIFINQYVQNTKKHTVRLLDFSEPASNSSTPFNPDRWSHIRTLSYFQPHLLVFAVWSNRQIYDNSTSFLTMWRISFGIGVPCSIRNRWCHQTTLF